MRLRSTWVINMAHYYAEKSDYGTAYSDDVTHGYKIARDLIFLLICMKVIKD